ncbi:MAG: Trk system potassium transporter TrkA [Hyphomicrobiaceae bacterium]
MKVIICGAGQVGYGIAERLAAEGNDVSVIDTSPELVQRVNDMLDARGVLGHGSHPDTLVEAGARDADMLIAATLHDEVNMVACQIAHSLFDIPTKIARVRAQSYLKDEWRQLFAQEHMAIDVVISPEVEVGEMVLRRLNLPGAFETMSFGDGRISAVGVHCEDNCPIVDTPLRQLSELFPDLPVVIVAIVRNGRLLVPHGDDALKVGDDAYFVAPNEQVTRTLKICGHEEQHSRRVIIASGGNIGYYVANEIEKRLPQVRTKLVELNRQRATEVAGLLPQTVVLHGSALNEDLLREADIQRADTMVALTNDDQVNILTCVLARQLGCPRNLCLINNPAYATVVRSLGIGAQINPRTVTVSRVLQHVRRGRIRGVFSIHNGDAELIETEALETAPIVGRPMRDLNLPDGIRFGAILREGKVIIPTGSTELEAKDRAVVFATAEHVRDVEQMFRVSLEYF